MDASRWVLDALLKRNDPIDLSEGRCEMTQTSSRAVRDGLKYIHETYGFMLERGYEVLSINDYDLGWQVVLQKSDLFVRVIRTRGDDFVSFRTGTQSPDEFIDIGSVVYAATGDKIPVSGDDSKELQKYLDKIETYFEGEYVKNEDGLRVAQKEYRETLPRLEIGSSKEPEIIPILHYPLMGIILLLLFGALTTLYMVVLDRLFSAFSLDSDSYGIFMGVISLLLAIGTMLLFWRRRRREE